MIISDELLRSTIRQHLLNEKVGYQRGGNPSFEVDLRGESEEALPELEGEEWVPKEGVNGKIEKATKFGSVDSFASPIIKKWFDQLNSKGYTVIVTSGYRTPEKQSTIRSGGQDVAKAGYSPHNFGLAVDINIKWQDSDGKDRQLVMTDKAAKAKPGNTNSKEDWISVLKDAGWQNFKSSLRWGGDFSKWDPVHFDVYPSLPSKLGGIEHDGNSETIATALNKRANKSGKWKYSEMS